MLMSLALIVPFGLDLLQPDRDPGRRRPADAGAAAVRDRRRLRDLDRPRRRDLQQSLVAAAWQLKNTTDSTAATHFALVGGAVFGGFAALHYWFPKMTGRTMGENLAGSPSGRSLVGALLAFVPLFSPAPSRDR